MPETGLGVSYSLDNQTIDVVVTRKSAGAQVLGHIEKRKKRPMDNLVQNAGQKDMKPT
jgi:hypothetical protein